METRMSDFKQIDQQRYLSIEKIIQGFKGNKIELIQAIIDLIYLYHPTDFKNTSFVKIAGLLNFSINLLKTEQKEILNPVISHLKNCTIYNIRNFAHFVNSEYSYESILKDNELNKKELLNIRRRFSNIKTILSLDDQNLFNYYQDCHHHLKLFFISLVKQSVKALGKAPCQFAFAFLGSNARQLATPYSDTEFFIIVENDDPNIIRYFQNVAQLTLLKIINLGETILPALEISVTYNRKRVNLTDMIFDNITPLGYSIDSALPQASKSPLGKKLSGHLIYRLIGSPTALAKLASLQGFQHDIYFPQIMRLSLFVYGDEELYNAYLRELSKNNLFSPVSYGICLLTHDIEKYLTLLYEMKKLSVITHEKYYVRPPTTLIDNLYMFLQPCKNKNSLNKLNELEERKIIDETQYRSLKNNLINALHVRLLQHSIFKKHTAQIEKKYLSPSTMISLFSFFKEKLNKHDSECLVNDAKLNRSYHCDTSPLRSRL